MSVQVGSASTKPSPSGEQFLSAAREGSSLEPTHDAVEYLKEYARQRPEVAALWCFGIGFILGWKLKPW